MTRKAYPDASTEIIETLALDYFIDSLTDSDIRLRLQECCPKTIVEAETIAVRLETHKLVDGERNTTTVNAYSNTKSSQSDLEQKIEMLTEKVEKLNTQKTAGSNHPHDTRPIQNGYHITPHNRQYNNYNRYKPAGNRNFAHRHNNGTNYKFNGRRPTNSQLQGNVQGNIARSSWRPAMRPERN